MPPLEQSISRLLQWKRIQALCRHLYGRIPRYPAVLVALILVIGALGVTVVPAFIQSGDSPTPVTGANDSATDPGAQLAGAISAEKEHLSNDLHQSLPDSGTMDTDTKTEIDDADDDEEEEEEDTETADDNDD